MIRNIKNRGNYSTYRFSNNQLDEKYSSFTIFKLINYVMQKGKKILAKRLTYEALDLLPSENQVEYVKQAINNLKIGYDLRTFKAGGTKYSIPIFNSPFRNMSVCARLIVDTARYNARKEGMHFVQSFVKEINNAYNKVGECYKTMMSKMAIVKQNMPLASMFMKKSKNLTKKK